AALSPPGSGESSDEEDSRSSTFGRWSFRWRTTTQSEHSQYEVRQSTGEAACSGNPRPRTRLPCLPCLLFLPCEPGLGLILSILGIRGIVDGQCLQKGSESTRLCQGQVAR